MNPIYKLRDNKNLFDVTALLYPKSCVVLAIMLIGLILLGILAMASYVTTVAYGSGFLPSAKYLLRIENEAGKPIDGAVLHTYMGDSETRLDRYPLDAYLIDSGLQSNADGVIIIDHLPKHPEIDSESWALFWVFPIINRNENYSGEITANGYKPLRFPLDQLIEVVVRNPFNTKTTKIVVYDDELELNVYELRLTLKKQ